MPTLPLKAYRIAPRKPWLRVEGGAVTFRMPTWFGGRTFATPVSNVAVADLELVQETAVDDVVLDEPLVIPYVYTTGPMTTPNVGLAFREPVALPPFRLIVRSQASEIAVKRPARDGRPAGRYVDGMLLRAEDPKAMVAALAAAGAEQVSDPDAWLVAQRALVTDPAAIAEIERRERRLVVLDRALMGAMAVGAAAFGAGYFWLGEGVQIAGAATAVAALVTEQALAWWEERRMFAPRSDGSAPPEGGA